MLTGRELTDREFEDVYGGKPPAKLLFWLRGDDLYHRVAGGWYLYPRFESLA